jgi:hypothetical protein
MLGPELKRQRSGEFPKKNKPLEHHCQVSHMWTVLVHTLTIEFGGLSE